MNIQNIMSREQAIRLMDKSGTIIMSEPDLHQLFAEAIVAGRPESQADPGVITGVKIVTSEQAKVTLWHKNPRLGHFIQDAGVAKLPSMKKTAVAPFKTQIGAAKDVEEVSAILTGK
jgi:hypothetical protein